MKWLHKVLCRSDRPAPKPAVRPEEKAELEQTKRKLTSSLSRADQAIEEAMGHADAIFYRGPERRKH